MESKHITVKVIGVTRYGSKSDAYAEKEELDVQDEGGHMFNLTRFRKSNENKIAKDYWYNGTQKPNTNRDHPEWHDTFNDVRYLDGGAQGVESPFWPEVNEQELDARQKSILVQSDMRTAAILLSGDFPHIDHPEWQACWDNYCKTYSHVKKFREEQEAK